MAQGGENETSEIKPKRPKRHRATKRALAQRDLKLIEKLAAGATIEEIAASEGISVKWARERKAAVLASRVIDTPHEFIKLQIRRLSEAMLVSYSAMSLGDLNGFLNHFRTMYFENGEAADQTPAHVSAWCLLPMWLALAPLLIMGVWWPPVLWDHFQSIAQALQPTHLAEAAR